MRLIISTLPFNSILIIIITILLNYVVSTQQPITSRSITISSDQCPPCFNCLLPAFPCHNSGKCNSHDGHCECPIGFGGSDCTTPLCGALSDGINRDPLPNDQEFCDCKEGWKGLTCNLCTKNQVCNQFLPSGLNGTCYTGGILIKENHRLCNITNQKIVEMLPNKLPQASLTCHKEKKNCQFQFWVQGKESFYCGFEDCQFDEGNENQLIHKCEKIHCNCLPGKFLCGLDGSVDISEFLDQEIKGPGKFQCNEGGSECTFEEPAMNSLILSIFGDDHIKLDCESSECMHYSEVPGYKRPEKPKNSIFSKVAIISLIGFLSIVGLIIMIFYNKKEDDGYMPIEWDDEGGKLMAHHVPTTLSFKEVGYQVNEVDILNNIHGYVEPGQVMAIMGASGAGKTSFLDILARRNKSGSVSGEICVNGKILSNKKFRKIVGYVDQEDTLMPTLTVYETILHSALLRLPKDMSLAAKKLRVLECMKELGILHIKDSKIGSSSKRGISGGEKRRVSIACEMVTSPAILFLDEPTSGLDAFNAQNVIESLVALARNYQRAIIFTIHQPRSNIYALFDQLVLLADGWLVYSGPANLAQHHFDSLGYICPDGYNIADYVVDITQTSDEEPRREIPPPPTSNLLGEEDLELTTNNQVNPWEHENNYNYNYDYDLEDNNDPLNPLIEDRPPIQPFEISEDGLRGSTLSILPNNPPPQSNLYTSERGIRTNLAKLVLGFKKSSLSHTLHVNLNTLHQIPSDAASIASTLPKGYKRANWFIQLTILSKRTFINLYRDPLLLLMNYTLAILLALLLGTLYSKLSYDIPGFQNRMGLFFFMLAQFGFSCLTSLQVFQPERILFMRERANGYYKPATYFIAKVLFDLVPLRVIPPLLMGVIVYPLANLNPDMKCFGGFLLVLVLFNLAASAMVLCLGIMIRTVSVANLLASLLILFSMLFSGLFLNATSLPPLLAPLQNLSLFHYALEALLVNEMRFMQLKDKKFGYEIDIPAATILSTFGFDASKFWYDVILLASLFGTFLILAYILLVTVCKEKR